MIIEMTWEEYVRKMIKMETSRYKSLRKAGKQMGIDAAILSKINNGRWVPDYKTLKKWFPNRHILKPMTIVRFETDLEL